MELPTQILTRGAWGWAITRRDRSAVKAFHLGPYVHFVTSFTGFIRAHPELSWRKEEKKLSATATALRASLTCKNWVCLVEMR
jgi:hypothetical protein